MTDLGADGADGGLVRHIPVMLDEVLGSLCPVPGEVHVDGTFGAGGYTRAILETGASVVAIDRDPDAIAGGRDLAETYSGRLQLVQGRFSQLDEIARQCGHASVDGVVLDIGVSSMQIDEGGRGFSFQKDGPLDMRMAQSGISAADVVNLAEQSVLTRVLGIYGEEKRASQIARAIVKRREAKPFADTLDLANLVESTVGRKHSDRIHPATRTFQALRVFVNQELEELGAALFAAERILKPGGRLTVVTFHSLEDRMVKRFLADRAGGIGGSRHLPEVATHAPVFVQKKRGAILASEAEAQINPRSRSAKLRTGERTAEAAWTPDFSIFGLPDLDLVRAVRTGR